MSNYRRVIIENHYYFITIVTYERKPILIENIDLLRESFKKAIKLFPFELYVSVILPDHFHIIIKPENVSEYPKSIGYIKKSFTQSLDKKYINGNISESRINRKEKGVWQRRFYEHTIRNEQDLYRHLEYIHFNPVKHGHVNSVKNWVYSSFQKFVDLGYYDINWGNCEDVKQISEMNLE